MTLEVYIFSRKRVEKSKLAGSQSLEQHMYCIVELGAMPDCEDIARGNLDEVLEYLNQNNYNNGEYILVDSDGMYFEKAYG